GINEEVDPDSGAEEISDTFRHHMWTGGLGIVPQGTPTNVLSTPTGQVFVVPGRPTAPPVIPEGPSDPKDPKGGDPKIPPTVPKWPPGDGTRLAAALGLADTSLLAGAANGALTQVTGMRQMNEVVWPSTIEEFLVRLMVGDDGTSALPDIDVAAVKSFFVEYVRGGGPLPVLRVRDQPYGVLPVHSVDLMTLADDPRTALLSLLVNVEGQWRGAVAGVARMDGAGTRVGTNPDTVLIEILSSQPDPVAFSVRGLNVRQSVGSLADVLLLMFGIVSPGAGLITYYKGLAARLQQLVAGIPEWVAASAGLTDPEDHYATSQAHRSAVELLRHLFTDARDEGTHPEIDLDNGVAVCDAMIEIIDDHESRISPIRGLAEVNGVFGQINDPALSYGIYEADATTWSEQWPLVQETDAASPTDSVSYLAALADEARSSSTLGLATTPGFDEETTEPLLAQIARQAVNRKRARGGNAGLGSALDALADRDPEELGLLLRQSLGVVSYRVDAWRTAIAVDTLDQMRRTRTTGTHIGGYGWVEDLEAGPESETEGFIQAPSLNHATAAAVLRSAWRTHGDEAATSALAVDLSSQRVRQSIEMLAGIRGGVALGELMGHNFERYLHDARLDEWIQPCRRAVLEATGSHKAPVSPVDGLLLMGIWDGGAAGNALDVAIGPLTEITAALASLDAMVDSVIDLTTAESVYQLVQGNLERAGATFEAIASGDVPPPEMEIATMPRRTRGVTHRVMLLHSVEVAAASDVASSSDLLATLAPGLQSLAARLLPDPTSTFATARTGGQEVAVSAADLGLGGLSAVAAVGGDGDTSTLANRVRLAAGRRLGLSDSSGIEVDLGDDGGAPDAVSMGEFAALAASLRRLLSSSRQVDAVDLSIAPSGESTGADTFMPLADALVARLRLGTEQLLAAVESGEGVTEALVEAQILRIDAALPPLEGTPEAWNRVAGAALAEAAGRLKRIDDSDGWGGERIIRVAMGIRLPLPKPTPLPQTLQVATDLGAQLIPDADATIPGWIQRMRRTRPRLAELDDTMSLAELVSDQALRFRVAQLAASHPESWVVDSVPAEDTLHLVLAADPGYALAGDSTMLAGLVIDDWVELIARDEVDTGVVFHFDTPGAEAPQAILLATPVEGKDGYTVRGLTATVQATLIAAHERAVGPDDIQVDDEDARLGQYIPMTALAEPIRFPVAEVTT
ncbi:MAG: hypothetical protein OEX04_15275, partial [Acidimicrobiia bacterium]|nr:hypothetical protein [Acidimicrobiia bacterium]